MGIALGETSPVLCGFSGSSSELSCSSRMPELEPQACKMAEYVCTLRPRKGSRLDTELRQLQATCQRLCGVDETRLYPPHVSVTGFFTATAEQADAAIETLVELALRKAVEAGEGLIVEVRRIVSTDGGHVLLDISAPRLAELAASFAAKAAEMGISIRPKAVRHMSLASGRNPEEQRRIEDVFRNISLGKHQFDLVTSRLLLRSSLESLRRENQAHRFQDLLLLPLPLPAAAPPRPEWRLYPSLHALKVDLAYYEASTPSRKRRAELVLEEALDAETTPEKVAKCTEVAQVST
mmetsp:Transcript_895/g.2242  ORF Transcript_895/g.2242 Transcript_895/m.2242 type:complete len:294 (+) Transcript_895:14-895(+)